MGSQPNARDGGERKNAPPPDRLGNKAYRDREAAFESSIEIHLIHAEHFKIKDTHRVKVRPKVKMQHFHILESWVS